MDNYRFIMYGRAFEGGDRLDKVAAGLTGLQHVFDGSYKAMVGRTRLSKNDRESFHLVIEKYEDGSFLANLGAIYTGVQTTLPLTYAFIPSDLWGHTKSAFEFLKFIFTEARDGKQVSIKQDGIGNSTVISGDRQYNFNGPVYLLGKQILGGVRQLDDLLEAGEVDGIGLGREKPDEIELGLADKGLFYPPTSVDTNPITLQCDIYDFNKYESHGRLKVDLGQQIPEGTYKFRNVGTQAVEDFILSMTETQVRLHCLVEFANDPMSETHISELLVVDIAA